ncbi:cytochrome P450 alkane hydroxylase [Pochonia chlamydosporia 170]|uniref:Cytochrome P450 alkane hydroxylase n=1 Tax=Pochonia chlamydosporia 170 TaxID=1380566 RepID=A0A179F149_METCM|nr:cytochrome P450 alkane hydroxylase [Pochonia chlamydosporia 170]OAQ59195.1 cytochrome P450 alkane hydroxylase [Pochonia chlamydosporia 170]
MLSNISFDAWTIALVTTGALCAYWAFDSLVLTIKLRKSSGVRSNVLASNPFTAIYLFWQTAYYQMNNRLLEYFNYMLSNNKSTCPHAAEVSVLGRRIIVTRDPEHIKAVLTSKFTQFGKGPQFHDIWEPFLGDSIFTTDGKQWQGSRSLIRPMFVKDRVRDLDIFDRWTDTLISHIPGDGQTVDMCDLFYRMTLDVTTDFLLGASVGSLDKYVPPIPTKSQGREMSDKEDSPRSEFSKAFTEVQRAQMILTILAPFWHVLPKRQYHKGIKKLEEFMNPYIQATLKLSDEELEKLSKSDKDFTFLHNIALYSKDPKVIRDQIMAVLLAGRDTTASTLSWTLYELCNYPAIWAKLRQEVLEVVGPTKTPSYDDLKSMRYLNHAIDETLRLYPAVPYNWRAAVANTTLPGQIGQPDIAANNRDIILYSTLAMQRRRDLYPPVSEKFADPDIYSPDRWEHWTPKPWQYVPFNGGPRICIGQNFALTEMAFVLVRLLQKYERIEYRGDWNAQYHKAEVVGCPGQGVPMTFYAAKN